MEGPFSAVAVAGSRHEAGFGLTAVLKQEAGTNKWKEKLKKAASLGYKAEEQGVFRGGNLKNDHVVILQAPRHSVPQRKTPVYQR